MSFEVTVEDLDGNELEVEFDYEGPVTGNYSRHPDSAYPSIPGYLSITSIKTEDGEEIDEITLSKDERNNINEKIVDHLKNLHETSEQDSYDVYGDY